ncbi:von Willebrand factor A domain-containing protein 1 [Saguinus oedipus]|uniref:von Willebrand factor A domain-containing protein 1 n=1 Tax=Saguinus oedipus TaxID=9490 RepID=A0ABQ9V8P9_SAGOE|nr:von Willebrand factor A domain-containing protein 1 [Saguinus oedipus]
MRPQQLHATEITSSSFRLAWPPLLTADAGYYVLELVPSAQPGAARRQQLPGNATDWTWAGLNPDTDYDAALVPESNVHLLRPQHLRVRTRPAEAGPGVGDPESGAGPAPTRPVARPAPEEAGPERIIISHARPRSLRVSWAPALGAAAALGYHVQFGPLEGGAAQSVEVPAGRNCTTLQGLAPGTAYLVTVTAAFRSGRESALSAKACTPDGPRPRPRPVPRAPTPGAASREL